MEENLNNNQKPINPKKEQELSEKTKRRKAKIAVITLSTIVVLFVGLQVYASTNGYGNVFFMIKNLITTGNLAGIQDIFSDKDITLSYKSIDLAERLKIQANRLEIREKETKLYLLVKGQNAENLPLKYEVSTKSNEENETTTTTKITGKKPENTESFEYEDILTLNYAVDENKTIILKISDSSDKELRTLEINLQTREITVKGETEFKKISEIELKKYLNQFSELNNGSDKADILLYIAENFQDNYKEFMKEEDYQYRMDKSTDRAYKNAIIKEFYGDKAEFQYVSQKDASLPKVEVLKGITAWQYNKENDSYQPLTAGEEYRHGKCLKIEDISYENGIYTVKYIYLLATGIDEDADRLEELPQYETTIKLKRDEENLYAKYQIVSLENGTEIKDKVSTNVEENDDIFQDASKLKYNSNFKDSQNGKIAILKLGENKFKTTKKDGYYTYTDMYGNSYDIKKIKNIESKFEITNKNNTIALFCCTIYYLDNNNYYKAFDVAVTVPNNFEGVFIPGNYSSYTGSTEFTKYFGVYSDETETNITNIIENNTNDTNTTVNTSTETEDDKTLDVTKWKQIWPEYIGMKFKVPNNFGIERNENIGPNMQFALVSGIFKAREHGGTTEKSDVPVKINFYNEFYEAGFNPDEIIEYSLDRTIKSMDNKGWSDWGQLKEARSLNNRTCYKGICKN